MCTPCRPGENARWYKWCRCMQSCGPVERVYEAYEKGNINGLHLLAELYDKDRLYKRWRTTHLTQELWANRRHLILYPQSPYGYEEKETLAPGSWIDKEIKFNYNNYLEGKDTKYWTTTNGWSRTRHTLERSRRLLGPDQYLDYLQANA